MGWPDRPTYSERESQYLTQEIAVLDDVLTALENDPSKPLLLDTTGSVIYTGTNLLLRLRRRMTVVYLAANPAQEEGLMQKYLSDPKPVLWRGAFLPKPGEAPRDTVARCYPTLIAARRRAYEALAHCTIDIKELRDVSQDPARYVDLFFAKVRPYLEREC
ncbi:MAG: hypothetical protein NVS9B4_06880 [Candidatus Acidiferrum sp.]